MPDTVGKLTFPFLAGGPLFGWQTPDLFGWLARTHWFLVSDLGSLGKGLTSDLSWLTVIAFALVPLSFWFLWRTRVRPAAAVGRARTRSPPSPWASPCTA